MPQEDPTFERCPHDEVNPYAQINNSLIRDESITPNCRWLIIYLLSNRDGWKIKAKQLIDHCKPHFGKSVVYKIINEAIAAGYIKREEFLVRGLKRFKYFVSEKPKFKKCLPYPTLRDAVLRDAENRDTKEILYVKKEHINNPPPLTPQKKTDPEPEMVYTEEEDEFFEMIMKDRKGPAVRSVSRYKKAVILEKRSQDSANHASPQNMTKRIEMAKEVYEESIKHPERFIGNISLDSLGILSCTGKGLNLLPLSPRESQKDWKSVVETWKVKKE